MEVKMALQKLWNKRNILSYKKNQNVPFCPEIRKFISNSRSYQTLFANCEGYYDKRIFNLNFENDLLIFIEKTLYDSKCYSINSQNIKDMIFEKIISLKTNYYDNKEVHLAVIWVYYFVYETKETKSTAIFKVFMSEEEAIFITSEGTTFHTWDSYLENCFLPQSFFCVPEHGTYSFTENNSFLKLNYFIAHGPKKDNNVDFQSYSRRIILPLLEYIKSLDSALKIKIAKLWVIIKTCLNDVLPSLMILVAKYCISYYDNGTFQYDFQTLKEELIMLGHTAISNNFNVDIFSFDTLMGIIGCFENPSKGIFCNFNIFFSLLSEIKTLFMKFRVLDWENYNNIAACFLDLSWIIGKGIAFGYLMYISSDFQFIGLLLSFISKREEFFNLFNEKKIENRVNNMAIKELPYCKDYESNKNKIIEDYNNDFDDSQSSTSITLKWHEQQQNMIKLGDKVLSLKTYLNNDSSKEEFEKYVEIYCTKISICNEPLEEWNFSNQSNDKKWVYLWSNPETGDHLYHFTEKDFCIITESLSFLIGKNYLLKPVGSKRFEVLDCASHETIGIIVDLLNNFFIGLFAKKAVTIHNQCCE